MEKAVASEEVVEVDIDQTSDEWDTTASASCDDKAMDNNLMFDYMYIRSSKSKLEAIPKVQRYH